MKKKILRLVVSGESVCELKANMQQALAELNGEETTTEPAAQPAARPGISTEAGALNYVDKSGEITHIPAIAPSARAPEGSPQGPGGLLEFGVDSKGLPWDQRIHSVSNGTNKDGSWRYRRGVEDALIAQVEAELREKMKQHQGGASLSGPVIPAVPVTPAAAFPADHQGNTPPTLAIVPALPPSTPVAPFTPAPTMAAPVAPPPQPVTFAHSVDTFKAQLIPTLAELVKQGKLTNEYVQSLKAHYKVDEIWKLNDAQSTEMFNMFCQHGLLTRVG